MDELMLDGNAVAGLLQEVFAVEMTTAVGICGGCGAAGPVGAVHVYRGAGTVLSCPHCDNVLAKIVKNDSRVWIDRPCPTPPPRAHQRLAPPQTDHVAQLRQATGT